MTDISTDNAEPLGNRGSALALPLRTDLAVTGVTTKEQSDSMRALPSRAPELLDRLSTRGGRPRLNRASEILALADLGFSRRQISGITGLKRRTLREYLYRIRKSRSVNKTVNKISRKCSSCGGIEFAFDRENGEVVCKKCGLVAETVMSQSQDLPYDTTYSLTSSIAFGRSLGQTLDWRGAFRVIAKGPQGTLDLPIRARQVQVMINALDAPALHLLLNTGSRLLREIGLDQDDTRCHEFAEIYGHKLRTYAAFLQLLPKEHRIQSRFVAKIVLLQMLKDLWPEKAEACELTSTLPVKYIDLFEGINKLLDDFGLKKS